MRSARRQVRWLASDPTALTPDDDLRSDRGYRPFIGVSVGGKPLVAEDALQVLSWCLRCDPGLLPIMIADELAHLNYMALSHYGRERALGRARRDGDRHIAAWQRAIECLPPEAARCIRFTRWPEVLTPDYLRQVDVVREVFAERGFLYETVHGLVEDFARRVGKRLTADRVHLLEEFVVQELPSALFGIHVDGVQHQLAVYPTASPTPMSPLLRNLQADARFAGLRERLGAANLRFNTLVEALLPAAERQPGARSKELAEPVPAGATPMAGRRPG